MFNQTVYSSNNTICQSNVDTTKHDMNWQRKDRLDGYTEFRNAKGDLVAVFNTAYLSK
jgi:hypothetical protein